MHNWVPTELQSVHLRGEGVVVVCVSHLVPVNPGLHLHEITPPLDVQYSVPVATQSLHFNADGVVATVGAAVVPNTSHFVPLYPALHLQEKMPLLEVQYSVPADTQSLHLRAGATVVAAALISHLVPL